MGVHVLRRLAGGEWGAYLVSTAAGALAVLKPLPVHEIFAERPVRSRWGTPSGCATAATRSPVSSA